MSARPTLPPAALAWLTGDEPVRIITVGCAGGLINRLIRAGHGVVAVDADPTRIARLAASRPHDDHLLSMVGLADELPVQPCVAQVVLLSGTLRQSQRTTAIDETVAHGQLSRALQPGGWVAGWQITRDDTVPWVRRLISLLREVDPDAMTGDQLAEPLLSSKYFPRIEQRGFRLWVPITRRGLIEMVGAQPAVARLDEAARRAVLNNASQIFDSATHMAELRLPYQLQCWRAHVDHHELTQPITFSDGALIIPI